MASINGGGHKQPLLGSAGGAAAAEEGRAHDEDGHDGHHKAGIHEEEQLRRDLELINQTNTETGLTRAEVDALRDTWGWNELAEQKVNPCLKFLSYFWGPMPVMIWIAIIVEFAHAIYDSSKENPEASQTWADFGVLMILQAINGTVGFYEEHNAGNAIAALKEQLAPKCFVKREGRWKEIPARELVPGDLIQLKLGDVIPADAILLGSGNDSLDVDQAALTGESLPVIIFHHEKAKMGSAVKRGELDAIVCGTGSNTFFGKAAGMIASVDEQGHFQKILFKITLVLLALSLTLCAAILIYLLVNKVDGFTAVGIVIVLLVASIPIAMQVVCTSTMAVGARRLAQRKVIVARLSAIEELAGMTILCSDKTGTLTKNKLELRPPILMSDMDEKEMFFYSALAAKRVKGNQDAIDFCICEKVYSYGPDQANRFQAFKELDFLPFNPTDKRTEATILSPELPDESGNLQRHIFKVTKGAPQVVLRLCLDDPKSTYTQQQADELRTRVTASIQELADRGFRALGVAIKYSEGDIDSEDVDNNTYGGWEFQGLISLFDPPRDDTKSTIEEATASGVEVKMVTGDQTAIAKETCRELGMGTNILSSELLHDTTISPDRLQDTILHSNGFAEVMPEDKFDIVNGLRKQGFTVGMTGDGVNDAPALKRADIGIAVEGSTDAARAAADIVLTEPGLSVIIEAMQRSRKIFQRMRNYSIYRIACTIELLLFFFFAIIAVEPKQFFGDGDFETCDPTSKDKIFCSPRNSHPASFTLPIIALVFITILNDGTIITIAHDKVIPEKRPQEWDLREVSIIATVQGLVACIGSLILVIVCFQNSYKRNHDSGGNAITDMFGREGDGFVVFGAVQTLVYLKISLSDFLTVFSARTRFFFFERRPGYALAGAFVVATITSTLLALFWPFHEGLVDTTYCRSNTDCKTMLALNDYNSKSVGYIWLYSIINFVCQDIAKVATYWALAKLNTANQERLDDMGRKGAAGRAALSYDRVARRNTTFAREASVMRETSFMRGAPAGVDVRSLLDRLNNLEREVKELRATKSS